MIPTRSMTLRRFATVIAVAGVTAFGAPSAQAVCTSLFVDATGSDDG